MTKMEVRRIRVTVIDEMLGTNPGDPKVHEAYIASKAPNAETKEQELAHMPQEEVVSKEMTVFYRNLETGEPEMAAHHMYGFFKSACGFLRKVDGTASSKVKAYKKVIDGLVRVYPDANNKAGRFITLHMPEGSEIGNCQRPLRASTPQGDRVALANSETVPAGTWFECDIVTLPWEKDPWKLIEEWLDYGVFNGLGQWRNSGKGAFEWRYVE